MKIIPNITPEIVIKLYRKIVNDGNGIIADTILWEKKIDNPTRKADEISIKESTKNILIELYFEFKKYFR